MMAVQAYGDLYGRQGSISIHHDFQAVTTTVQAVSSTCLRERRMQKFVEENFTSIHSDLRKGFRSSMEIVQPQLTVSSTRLGDRKMQKFVEDNFTSIHCDPGKGLRSSMERSVQPQLTCKALNEEKSPGGNYLRNVGQESCHNSGRQVFLSATELRIGNPACRNDEITGRLQLHFGARHSQVTTVVQESNKLPRRNNGEKNSASTSSARKWKTHNLQGTTVVQESNKLPKLNNNGEKSSVSTSSARRWKSHNLQVGRGGDNIPMPSASTPSEVIVILKNRHQQGIKVDSYMFVEVLKLCLKQKDLPAARDVHDWIIQSGMDKNPYVANTLLNVYIKCGRLQDARRVFDGLAKKTIVTWGTMIAGYAQDNQAEEALEVFNRMRKAGAQPNEISCLSILKACGSPLALQWGKEVHAYTIHAGLESDVRVGTALVQMYAKCGCMTEAKRIFENLSNGDVITSTVMIGAYAASGSIDDARLVFDRMEKRDVIIWNTMIGGYAESGCGVEAYRLFLQMQQEGFIPNAITYINILNASASAGALEWVKEVHSHALKAGLESDLRVSNALVHMYAKSGRIDDARLTFDRSTTRDVVTWNTMIGAYAESGCGEEAYRLFLQMEREGVIPNPITYMNILNASASAGALERVKEIHSHALKAGLESNLCVGNALVHMYAKSGSIDDARLIFERIKERDVVTWNTMIGGLAHHGCGHEALELFRKMNSDSVEPDRTTFVAVLSACCHAGLLDDGRRLFLDMTQHYGIERDVIHYTCMVDLLGRAGQLEEAKLFIGEMPVEPVAITWKALLSACRTYGNVELGELAVKELVRLEPNDSSVYVLLSNIYAAAGKWGNVSLVRTMMQENGVRKEPGRSWIEVDSKIHEFFVGDTSHPESKAIYTELNKLTEKLKAEGYIPDTQLVLREIEEEDKELALCSHSEKLAIVYGLMHTPGEKPIRVYKNLRVCPDCHTATKFISKVTGREIIARDANRFHHFKDGVCSCGDYW